MTSPPHPIEDLRTLLELEPVKPDAWLGMGPDLGWGRIYGGQIVAQALRAATLTVAEDMHVHSMHAYFIRAGIEVKPVLFEVERVRDGRTFGTRQVVAHQPGGAILNCIASFQRDEQGDDVQVVQPPASLRTPADGAAEPTDLLFERRTIERSPHREARTTAWMRVKEDLGEDRALHACAFAYMSDEYPLGSAIAPHSDGDDWEGVMAASLDHAIWFHRPLRTDEWLGFAVEGSGVANARGLAHMRVFTEAGVHVATVAQEGLVRPLAHR